MTTLEAARYLDSQGYDCQCLRNGIIWRVTDPNGKKMRYFAHELQVLARCVKDELEESSE
jgi:hypothetical protein